MLAIIVAIVIPVNFCHRRFALPPLPPSQTLNNRIEIQTNVADSSEMMRL